MIKNDMILASASPRRRAILEQTGFKIEVVPSAIDESKHRHEVPELLPEMLARLKAADVAATHTTLPVLAADTVVILNGELIEKPADAADACHMLSKLSGRTHTVITGCAISTPEHTISFSDTTEVDFSPLTAEEIEHYVQTYRPLDKAGAYGVQEWIGMVGIRAMRGSFYNVMGLPIHKVYAEWKKMYPEFRFE